MVGSQNKTNAAVAFTPNGEFITVITSKNLNETGEDIVKLYREIIPEYRYFPAIYDEHKVVFLECPGAPFCQSNKCLNITYVM